MSVSSSDAIDVNSGIYRITCSWSFDAKPLTTMWVQSGWWSSTVGSIASEFVTALPRFRKVVTDLANEPLLSFLAVERLTGVSTIHKSQCWSSGLRLKCSSVERMTVFSKALSIRCSSVFFCKYLQSECKWKDLSDRRFDLSCLSQRGWLKTLHGIYFASASVLSRDYDCCYNRPYRRGSFVPIAHQWTGVAVRISCGSYLLADSWSGFDRCSEWATEFSRFITDICRAQKKSAGVSGALMSHTLNYT